jgi:putative heme-binding domain-containing protein
MKLGSSAPALVSIIDASGKSNERIASGAIAALSKVDSAAAAQKASELLSRTEDQQAALETFEAFLSREDGAKTLAAALQAKSPTETAVRIGLQTMNASGRRDASLAAILEKAAKASAPGNTLQEGQVAEMAQEVKERGNSKRGAEVFARAELGCAACHLVNGQGGKVGPDLSSLGSAQPVDFIIRAILDPQKEIKEGFTSYSVATRDGESYQGYLERELPSEIVLRDPLQNAAIRIPRENVKQFNASGSLMPSGLADGLKRDEFRDLVRFLSELGTNK